jgi:hypothetical protein
MPLPVRHFYHVYAGGAWAEPVRSHIAALGRADFRGDITVGLVGPEEDRNRCRELINFRMRSGSLPVPDAWIEADEGFEQVTLTALRDYVHAHREPAAILYAHTKGAHDNSDWNAAWRRCMTRQVVGNWEDCVRQLGTYEAIGCHWLTKALYHQQPYLVTTPMFGGNFWWAKSAYLRKLPPLGNEYRHQAEEWVGLGNPRVLDLLPGWPSWELCAP